MNLQPHRQSLYDFVVSGFEEDFERAHTHQYLIQFQTFRAFEQHQRNVIENADLNTLTFLQQFQSLIEIGNIELVDKESMVPFEADGFIFVNGKIVFTNAR